MDEIQRLKSCIDMQILSKINKDLMTQLLFLPIATKQDFLYVAVCQNSDKDKIYNQLKKYYNYSVKFIVISEKILKELIEYNTSNNNIEKQKRKKRNTKPQIIEILNIILNIDDYFIKKHCLAFILASIIFVVVVLLGIVKYLETGLIAFIIIFGSTILITAINDINKTTNNNSQAEKVILQINSEQRNHKNNEHTNPDLNWKELREIVLDKYGYCCSICGNSGDVDIHHKIPIKDGGTNEIENLIAVCRNCHEKLHHFKLKEEKDYPSDDYGQKVKKENKSKKGYIILQAISKKGKLKIKYEAHKYETGEIETTIRTIRPISIKYGYEITDNNYINSSKYDKYQLFVYAFCELRHEMRLFRLDRIEII